MHSINPISNTENFVKKFFSYEIFSEYKFWACKIGEKMSTSNEKRKDTALNNLDDTFVE